MAQFYLGHFPDILYHGTEDDLEPGAVVKPARECRWWSSLSWEEFYEGEEGDHRTAYPNIIWEYLGLLGDRTDSPEWAKDIVDFDDLGARIGMLFVTDRPEDAERYGVIHEIDMTSPVILDVAEDPNAGTHNTWILVLEAGKPLPVRLKHTPFASI